MIVFWTVHWVPADSEMTSNTKQVSRAKYLLLSFKKKSFELIEAIQFIKYLM